MHRIDSPTAVDGKFVGGDPNNSINATNLTPAWSTAVQEEIATFIESTGIVLDKTRNSQLTDAISNRLESDLAGGFGVLGGRTRADGFPNYLFSSGTNIQLIAGTLIPVTLKMGSIRRTLTAYLNVTPPPAHWQNGGAVVNEPGLTSDPYVGEVDYAFGSSPKVGEINIDALGSLWDAQKNNYVGIEITNGTDTGYSQAWVSDVQDPSRVGNIKYLNQGVWFASFGNRVPRCDIADNVTLSLMKLSTLYVYFTGDNYTVPNMSSIEGKISHLPSAPASPSDGDIYFDITKQDYFIYSSTGWVLRKLCVVGEAMYRYPSVSEGARGVFRPAPFYKAYSNENTIKVSIISSDTIRVIKDSIISVDGNLINVVAPRDFTLSATLSAQNENELASTDYYWYMDNKGAVSVSTERHVVRNNGLYHPGENSRCWAVTFNNSDSHIKDGSNPSIWERYNQWGRLAKEFKMIVDADDLTVSSLDGGVVPYASVTRPAVGQYRLNLESGFPGDLLPVSGVGVKPSGSTKTSPTSIFFPDEHGTKVYLAVQTLNDTGLPRNGSFNLTVSYTGKAAYQVNLDNSIKG